MTKRSFKKFLSQLITLTVIENYLIWRFGYNSLTYSQYGEDVILRNIFSKKQRGFFVDVGAHHPTRFSNTYYLYRKGWSGINIDAMPGSMELFNKERPRDINIEFAISNFPAVLPFHVFDEPALNTFSPELAHEHVSGGEKQKEIKSIQTHTLGEILKTHVPIGQTIDLITVDTESLDLEVLKSNDWNNYAPTVIVIEDREHPSPRSAIMLFLVEKQYDVIATLEKTLIFTKKP